MAKEYQYRGIFQKLDGTYLALNFFAENRELALSHALYLATASSVRNAHGHLTVARATKKAHDVEAGKFYSVVWINRNFIRIPAL